MSAMNRFDAAMRELAFQRFASSKKNCPPSWSAISPPNSSNVGKTQADF